MTEFSHEELEKGRLLFAAECQFLMGVVDYDSLPDANQSEIAFAGRSNVGKSSLINALVNRKNLARSSNTPGRTQEINFFDLAGQLYLVDLPGYGYAKVSKSKVKAWTRLILDYLKGRVTLRRACVLIDSRHGLKDSDREILELLDKSAVQYYVVLTKADKIKTSERDKVVEDVQAELKKHPAAFPMPFLTSAEKGWGIAELRALLSRDADG